MWNIIIGSRLFIGVGLAAFVAGCASASSSPAARSETAGPGVEAMSPPSDPAPTFATIAQLQAQMEEGDLTSVELVNRCLARIAAFDKAGPELNAMVTVDEAGARAAARALDTERAKSGPRGPLHGIPVILKDNYDTKDMPTTAGSAILADSVPPDDATVTQRLREAGAVILGKSHMSEFAASYGKLGYGSVIGQTKNPYNLLRDPSGSSSGSAVAVVAGYAPLATGTDTVGSVRAPSAVTGVVGIKPTMGLVSRDGIVPASLSFDVAGPHARTVADAAVALRVMASQDPADPATQVEGWKVFDVDAALAPNALSGARLGVVRTWSGANEGVDAVFENALEILAEHGAELVEVELPDPLGNLWSVIGPVLDADFEPEIEAYLATLSEGYPRTLEALIAAAEAPELVNSEHPVNPGRIGGFRDALGAGGYDSPARKKGLEKLKEVRAMVRRLFADNDVDAFVFPTMACPASVRFDAEDPTYVCDIDDPYRPTYVASATGFPDVSVPAGLTTTDTMPVGLSFLGLPFTEARLIGLAAHFESALAAPTQPPPTTPHLDR